MINEQYHSQLMQVKAQRAVYQKLCMGLVAANILLGFWILRTDIDEKIIVAPPVLHKQFWIKADQVSREYLELMGDWLAGLHLSVTPKSVDYRNDLFLQYVSPDAYARLKTQFELQAERIKRENLSTLFFPVEYQFYKDQIAITGDFITLVGEVKNPPQQKTFRMGFTLAEGRLWVTEFKEVDSGQAFAQAKSSLVSQ